MGVVSLVVFSMLASTSVADEALQSAVTKKTVEINQKQMIEQRKEVLGEAIATLEKTHDTLKKIEAGKTKEAIDSLAEITGKLEIMLAQYPDLALIPVHVTSEVRNVIASVSDIKNIRHKVQNLLKHGRVQEARKLLNTLVSETVIRTINLPLATYPDAMKEAAVLLNEGKLKETNTVLQTALNELIVTDVVLPIPVANAQILLVEASVLAEKNDRTEAENEHLNALLEASQKEIKFAEALGYGNDEDFSGFYKEIKSIKTSTQSNKGEVGLFDKIKSYLSNMTTHVDNIKNKK